MLEDFEQMRLDSMMAIELNDQYIKAFIANGEALVMLGQENNKIKDCEKGIDRLRRAH